jgi:hypothetical protein
VPTMLPATAGPQSSLIDPDEHVRAGIVFYAISCLIKIDAQTPVVVTGPQGKAQIF